MAGSARAPPLTCQLCSDPIDTEEDEHIEATCSTANCTGGSAHVECAIQYRLKLVNVGTKGGQNKKKMVQQRPHQELRGSNCWFAHGTDHFCDGKIVDAELVKANAQVLKKVKKLADLAPAPVTKLKPRKKGSTHPQPQTRGPPSGGVAPVGHRHDIEIKPLAARDNRLGTSSANKVAGKTADSNKAKNLTMCPYMQSSVGQCPILHKCAFAHSEEEIAKNEQFAREKTQLQRVLKASKKHAQRNGALSQDAFEGLPEGALELAESHYSVSMDSSAWDHPQEGSKSFAPASSFVVDDTAGGWTTVGASGTRIPATNGHTTGNWADHGSNASASSRAPSFPLSQTHSLAPQPAAPLLGPVATREIIRWKLNSCTSRLTNLGVTWAVAEAAAKATGGNDNAAGDLIFSGTDQAAWGEREVDISNEVAQALSLMEPPVTAPRKRVEQAIVSARGNIEEAKQELHSQASQGAASPPLPGSAPSPPAVTPPRPAHPVNPPPSHNSQRPLSRASSTAASAQSLATAAGGPPAAFNEDEWAPKWEDETPAAPAAADPSPQPQHAVSTPASLPQQPPPTPPQTAPLQQLQLPVAEPKPEAAQAAVLGPITPERQAPLVVATASPAATGANAPTDGAFTFGDFPPPSQPLSPLARQPPSPATQPVANMSALDLGSATPQQAGRQQEAAAVAPAPAQQPEEFDDLLDMLMA